MNIFDRMIATVAPGAALERVRARRALDLLAHYDAATTGRRSKSWRPSATDADGAAARRDRMSYVARDMIRNTPFAARAQHVITNNTVGDGIIPKIAAPNDSLKKRGLELVEQHFDTTAIDADGRQNLYGLQRLIMNTVVESGECLVRRRRRSRADRLPLPFQLQVLEPEYLDTGFDGRAASGNLIREGIEYDLVGRRVAYHLYDEHPGGTGWRSVLSQVRSRRVPASEILHIYRQDRPGQMRGVSWFAPIALSLQDLGDHQDAQLMRQKIAACFAAFRRQPDGIPDEAMSSISRRMQPGAIVDLGPGEDITFGTPPKVDGFDEFTRVVLRSVAAGMGITYEALAGDLSNVNFSSARMGRVEMDRNVSSWQWLMMITQFCQPLGEWFREAWSVQDAATQRINEVQLKWVPPHRILVDPNREVTAIRDKISAGLESRQGAIRQLGHDPERLIEEIRQDAAEEQAAGIRFSSSVSIPQPESEAVNE